MLTSGLLHMQPDLVHCTDVNAFNCTKNLKPLHPGSSWNLNPSLMMDTIKTEHTSNINMVTEPLIHYTVPRNVLL